MNEQIKSELINLGLNALKQAVCHFADIKDCNQSDAIYNILNGAVVLGESIINSDKK